ncbi:hypothetical protein T08_8411 [Trichinella sp. T8]|nr:hypothetical protein T08_8411 [Trichinella sp. T8]
MHVVQQHHQHSLWTLFGGLLAKGAEKIEQTIDARLKCVGKYPEVDRSAPHDQEVAVWIVHWHIECGYGNRRTVNMNGCWCLYGVRMLIAIFASYVQQFAGKIFANIAQPGNGACTISTSWCCIKVEIASVQRRVGTSPLCSPELSSDFTDCGCIAARNGHEHRIIIITMLFFACLIFLPATFRQIIKQRCDDVERPPHVEGTLLANLGTFGSLPSKMLTLPESNGNDSLMNNFATIALDLHSTPLEAHGCPMFLQAYSTMKNDVRVVWVLFAK